MDDRISTQITRSLIDYLQKTGADLDAFFAASDYSREYLCASQKWLQNEDLITLLALASQTLGRNHLAYETGRNLIESHKEKFLGRFIISANSTRRSVENILEWVAQVYPIVTINIEWVAHRKFRARVVKKIAYIHTHEHCQLVQGILEGIITVCGVIPQKMREETCLLPIDMIGEVDGRRYRIDDDGQLLEASAGDSGEQWVEKVISKIQPEALHEVQGIKYNAGACTYLLEWKDGRPFSKLVWDKSVGAALRFFRVLFALEKTPLVDGKTYQQVTSEWKHWLNWEESYSLTKFKYLAYIGVVALSALPITGHFFDSFASDFLKGFSGLILSLLIMVFGISITRLQIGYARQLHRQKEQSEQFMQRAGVGVTMVNTNHEIVYANPQILNLFGEVVGRKCHEAFRWESKPCAWCKLDKVINEKTRVQTETRKITREGEERWFYITSTPILDRHEKVMGMLNISTDINEKKLLEFELAKKQAALEASERKYKNFMENAADAIMITDPAGCLIEASKQLYQLLGINEQESQDAKVLENMAYGADEVQKLSSNSQAMIKDGCPREFELRLQRKDGNVHDLEVRAIPILAEGEASWMQFIMRDITERKRQEFEKNLMLSISKAIKDAPNLQDLLDQALKGICAIMEVPIAAIFLKDPRQPQLQLAAQVGRSPEAIKHLARIAIDGSANNIASRTAILNKPIVVSDVRQLKLDHQMKQKIDLLGVSSLICMPMVMEDKLHGVIQIATRDTKFFDQEKINILTQMANELAVGIARQRLRDALEESNRQLLKKHKELENATMQLLQSEKMASIGQLAAGIAHEINNPMGFINANLSVLDEYRKDLQETFNSYETTLGNYASEDTAHKHEPDLAALKVRKEQVDIKGLFEDFAALIKESREGAERVKRIIINLKEFSHPDKGVIELADLNAGLESTLNIVWNELKYKSELKKEYGEIPKVLCYPQELNQVFMNILVNAAQAITSKGEIKLKTWAENSHVFVQISDTGAGISAENLTKIFDPFFTTKDVGKGTGLGLSISYGIIKKHNGEIKVESEVGTGSSFTITLPVAGPELQKAAGK